MPATLNGAAVYPTAQAELQARLADPRTVDSLNRLLDRLDVVTASVEMLDGFVRRSSEVADNISDSIEELREKESGEVVGLIEKLPKLARAGTKMADVADSLSFDRLLKSGILDRLADPSTLESLTALLNKLDLIVFAVAAIDEFLRRGDEVADSISESIGELRGVAASVDVNKIKQIAQELPRLTEAGHQLIASGLLDKMSDLTEAGMLLYNSGFFEPKMVKPLAEMGRLAVESYVAAQITPRKTYGLFDLFKLLKDPATQKSLHIIIEMTKHFGSKVA